MLDALGYIGLPVADGAADQRSLRFSSTLFNRELVPVGARCYHIYICSQASIMQHADLPLFLFWATFTWGISMYLYSFSRFKALFFIFSLPGLRFRSPLR